jgi:hypothetical protein
MSKARMVLILGVWVALLPYLGFPYSWKDYLFTISGFLLIYVSYALYSEQKKSEKQPEVFDNFSENQEFTDN